jgi:hypothetical protein
VNGSIRKDGRRRRGWSRQQGGRLKVARQRGKREAGLGATFLPVFFPFLLFPSLSPPFSSSLPSALCTAPIVDIHLAVSFSACIAQHRRLWSAAYVLCPFSSSHSRLPHSSSPLPLHPLIMSNSDQYSDKVHSSSTLVDQPQHLLLSDTASSPPPTVDFGAEAKYRCWLNRTLVAVAVLNLVVWLVAASILAHLQLSLPLDWFHEGLVTPDSYKCVASLFLSRS